MFGNLLSQPNLALSFVATCVVICRVIQMNGKNVVAWENAKNRYLTQFSTADKIHGSEHFETNFNPHLGERFQAESKWKQLRDSTAVRKSSQWPRQHAQWAQLTEMVGAGERCGVNTLNHVRRTSSQLAQSLGE